MTDPYHGPSPERQARHDMKLSGFGIMVLGGLGFLGAVLVMAFGGPSNEEMLTVIAGGGILLVLGGSMVAAFAIRAKHGPASAFAGGCGSVALSVGLGVLLFAAAFVFLFVSCFAIVMTSLSGTSFH